MKTQTKNLYILFYCPLSEDFNAQNPNKNQKIRLITFFIKKTNNIIKNVREFLHSIFKSK